MTDKKFYNIAIVDDVKSVCNSIRRELMLATKELSVLLNINDFQDPKMALKFIVDQAVDLVITDIKMPYLTGDKLVAMIKQKKPQLPIIVMTGYATKENIYSVLQADKHCEIIAKPWAKDRMIGAVGQLLEIQELIPKDGTT